MRCEHDNTWFTWSDQDTLRYVTDTAELDLLIEHYQLTTRDPVIFKRIQQQLTLVKEHLTAGSQRYVWALARSVDLLRLPHLLELSQQPLDSPHKLLLQQLTARFPSPPTDLAGWIIGGDLIACDTALSRVTHAGDFAISMKRKWWECTTGLQYGVWLVRVKQDEPLYHLESAHLAQLIEQIHRTQRPPLDWQLAAMHIETYLPRFLKNIPAQQP